MSELKLDQVMKSETHWADSQLNNPCTKFFVDYCISSFPGGRTMSGVGDTYAHFHSWVNEQSHPHNIPPELTNQMWQLREKKRKCWKCGNGQRGLDPLCSFCAEAFDEYARSSSGHPSFDPYAS